jgi:protein-tyrosine kinase
MSRVHDALRKAAQDKPDPSKPPAVPPVRSNVLSGVESDDQTTSPASVGPDGYSPANPADSVLQNAGMDLAGDIDLVERVIRSARRIPFTPSTEALLVHPDKPKEPPAEEFRSLRTRLNHLQNGQPLHTLVITSASPGEGKSFTACNLAISQAQLVGKRILLADFDFRRPSIEKTFGLSSSPGITDYLLGKASLGDILCRVEDSNLYLLGAGSTVPNPLELLNLKECNDLLETLRDHFDWVILDSPPLLFAADGNLLATMCDAAILVVRISTTTYDSVSRALQSLCENNVLGIVVNGAHRGELYSKYAYYHNYYYSDHGERDRIEAPAEPEAVTTT